jgi:uncharacterized membrane protein
VGKVVIVVVVVVLPLVTVELVVVLSPFAYVTRGILKSPISLPPTTQSLIDELSVPLARRRIFLMLAFTLLIPEIVILLEVGNENPAEISPFRDGRPRVPMWYLFP